MHCVHSTREEQLASAASSSLFPITIIIYLLAPASCGYIPVFRIRIRILLPRGSGSRRFKSIRKMLKSLCIPVIPVMINIIIVGRNTNLRLKLNFLEIGLTYAPGGGELIKPRQFLVPY